MIKRLLPGLVTLLACGIIAALASRVDFGTTPADSRPVSPNDAPNSPFASEADELIYLKGVTKLTLTPEQFNRRLQLLRNWIRAESARAEDVRKAGGLKNLRKSLDIYRDILKEIEMHESLKPECNHIQVAESKVIDDIGTILLPQRQAEEREYARQLQEAQKQREQQAREWQKQQEQGRERQKQQEQRLQEWQKQDDQRLERERKQAQENAKENAKHVMRGRKPPTLTPNPPNR
jgi:hypothetical protein